MNTFKNTKYPRVNLRIPEELRAQLQDLAHDNSMSVSRLIKQFIERGIALQKKSGQ